MSYVEYRLQVPLLDGRSRNSSFVVWLRILIFSINNSFLLWNSYFPCFALLLDV